MDGYPNKRFQSRRANIPDFGKGNESPQQRPSTNRYHMNWDAQEGSKHRNMADTPSRNQPGTSYIPNDAGSASDTTESDILIPLNRVMSKYRTLRDPFNGVYFGDVDFDTRAEKIVAHMEQDGDLMQNTPVSEQLRKEALREMPHSLSVKRCVKTKLSKSVSKKSKRKSIGLWKYIQYSTNITWFKFKDWVTNVNYFELWSDSLKDIEGRFGSGYASYFKFFRWLFVMNLCLAVPSIAFIVVPQIIYDVSGVNGTTPNTRNFQLKDIFIGDGYFSESVLYYGHYTNNTINVIANWSYNMPAAYFSTVVLLYLLAFLALSISAAKSYRRSFIQSEGGFRNVFANRVFCGWDFGITTKEAAELKSSSIYNELTELLNETLRSKIRQSFLYKFYSYTIWIVVTILYTALLGTIGWGLYLLLDHFSKDHLDTVVVTAIVANIVLMVLPTLTSFITKYEDYSSPRIALYVTLCRTYLLGCVILGVILSFWLTRTKECWETSLGQEVYRLVIYDFLFSVVGTCILNIFYFGIQKLRGKSGTSEFNVAKHTLQIIYNQALVWVGFLYSPLLPCIVTVKMLLVWYLTSTSIRALCRPPKRSWLAAQTRTWFLSMTFLSILLAVAAHGYTLKSIPASTCGPFTQYQYIYEIVTNEVSNTGDIVKIILYVTRPGVVALVMIALGIFVFYVKEQGSAHATKVDMLREMLVWQAKDKDFLLKLYASVNKGEKTADFEVQ